MNSISDSTELFKIRKFIENKALTFGFNEEEANNIALAVDEACTNLIHYAYNYDKTQKFSVKIETDINHFVVNILDNGVPFNPLNVPPPNMKEYFDTYHRGGLGIHIMRSVMDEISYMPSSDNRTQNILKLKKRLHS